MAEPHVLILRRRYLGDVVLLGSLIRNIRLAHPNGRVDVLVDPGFAPVLGLNPDVNAVVHPPASLFGWLPFLKQLRAQRYTHVLNFDNTERTALIARASGAAVRAAIYHGDHRLKAGWAYTHKIHDASVDHESRPITEFYLLGLRALGIEPTTREVKLSAREPERAFVRTLVGSSGPVLLVHPGSRSAYRVWPADRFAAVCDRVQDELGAQVVLVGGPSEKELIASIRKAAKTHLLALASAPSLSEFAALAKESSLMLCHDSGPMHVAAAVGTPVVALFGSQNPALFRPMGDGHTLLTPPMPCTACVAVGQCVPEDSYHNYCVRQHTVEQVYEAVREALSRSRGESR